MNVTLADDLTTNDGWISADDAPYRCEVCGTSLEYGGRGRKPRFCAEHKKGASKSASGSGKATASMQVLENNLADIYRGLGMGVSLVDPVSGMEIASAADKLAHSWITLAESNPKVKKFLIKLTTGSGVGAVVIAHGTVAYPILARNGMLPSFLGGKE